MAFARRELSPIPAYFILSGGYAFFTTMVFTVNLVFQTQEAGLNPFQLVLIGAALEASVLLCEVPTGVLADVYSRRLSVLIGLVLAGGGLMLSGVFAEFWPILLAQPVWGLGFTFISGAKQAWIADEVGAQQAGAIYLRTAQVEQVCRLAALPLSVGIATFDLNLPILLGGGLLFGLAAFLTLTMPERGFSRPPRTSGGMLRDMTGTFVAGGSLVRHSPLLITVFAIAAFYGMASEGVERLWVAHFYHSLGFPRTFDLEPVVWIGAIRFGSALLGIGAVELLRRRIDTNSHAAVSHGLFAINALQVLSLLVFAAAGGFYVGMVAFWAAVTLSRVYDPLYLAWLNQSIESRVRATVISMRSQTDALGQIAGGPMLGAVGTVANLRFAMLGAAVVLLPALLLYQRAFGQGAPPTGDDAAAPTSETRADA